MFISISQIECLLTPRLSESYKWGFFTSWRGGVGKNIEDDLCQEISNGVGKKIVQRMGANKTVAAISKVCKAVSGIKDIIDNYDEKEGIQKQSVYHTKIDSLKEEKEMINDLKTLRPFKHTPGRKHHSFPGILRHPFRYLNQSEFCKWLNNCRNEFPV